MATPGWGIELLGERRVIEGLADSLPIEFDPHLEKHGDDPGDFYVLRAAGLDEIAESNGVRREGHRLLANLLGAWAAKNRRTMSVQAGSVVEFASDGSVAARYTMATMAAAVGGSIARGVGVALGPDGQPLPPPPPQPSPVQEATNLADAYPQVAVLLGVAAKADNWIEVYKVFDAAKQVVKLLHRSLPDALGDQWGRIRYLSWSSQHERHVQVDDLCPVGFGPGPMPLGEAVPLALWLADHLLHLVAAEGGSP